jgi:hypothetical protein
VNRRIPRPGKAVPSEKTGIKRGDAAASGAPTTLIKQKTLAKSVVLSGQGLHSGVKTGLILHPMPANSGIRFTGISGEVTVPAHLDYVGSTGYATSLRTQGFAIGTVEHLLAVLSCYGIGNLLIKVHGEVPILDGSALEFCQAIEEAGIQQEDEDVAEIVIDRVYRVEAKAGSPSSSNRRKSSRCITNCVIPLRWANSSTSTTTATARRFAMRSHRLGRLAFSKILLSFRLWDWPTAGG